MIAPNKVICEFNNSLQVIRIVLFQEEQKFRFNGGLVIIFFLVFDNFNCDGFASLVVLTFNDISKGTFTNYFVILISITDLITLGKPVIPFIIVKAIVNKSL